jgi:hypothetical protein
MHEDVPPDIPQGDAEMDAYHSADIDMTTSQNALAIGTSCPPVGGYVTPLTEASIHAASGAMPVGKRRDRPLERDGKRAKGVRAIVDPHPGTSDTPGARGSRDTVESPSHMVPIIVLDDDEPPLLETSPPTTIVTTCSISKVETCGSPPRGSTNGLPGSPPIRGSQRGRKGRKERWMK